MGLIKAITGAAGGVLADSWREFFYCDSDVLNENVLATKGQKRTSDKGRSSNTRGESNIISDGSIIAVNDGQCMIIVESGEIVDVCAEPGQFVYDRSTEPSIFYGSLGEGIKATFERIGQRFTFGGDTGKDQRVYYFNTKEIYGNKYGTTSPVPFRVVDANINLDLEAGIRMNGEYSYRLTDPLLFYKNVCGNVEEPYTRDRIESQMKSELLLALQPALARISEMGVRYSSVPAHTRELAGFLNEELTNDWSEKRGISIVSFGVNSINLSEEDEKIIKDRQAARSLSDPNLAAGYTAGAFGDAMRTAAGNEGGAMNAFMGVGMANMMGGQAASQMFQQGGGGQPVPQQNQYQVAAGGGYSMPQQQPQVQQQVPMQQQPQMQPQAQPAPMAGGWVCPQCGQENTANFCGNCGTPKPAPASWVCPQCGQENTANFCGNCGTPRS